jgi:hypothetical protein
MANWNQPTITSNYLDFVSEMNAKFFDNSRMYYQDSTGMPQGAVRFNRSGFVFDEWDAAQGVWIPRVIGISGGGTGSNNPAGIRTNLGLGTMSTQNSNAVNITGGSITGVTFNASNITQGVLSLANGGTGYPNSLGAYGTTFVCDGSRVIIYSGSAIAELNASALVTGNVPAARLPTNIAYLDVTQSFFGRQHFQGEFIAMGVASVYSATVHTRYPVLNFMNPGAAAGLGIMRWFQNDGNMQLQKLDNAYSVATDLFTVSNAGVLAGNGGNIYGINAYNINQGLLHPTFMGQGTVGDTNYFLRSDGWWAIPPSGGGGGAPIPFPSGMISMFATGCPAGWTRVAALDGRFPIGSTGYGQQGGNSRHGHTFSVNTTSEGGHSHSFSSGVSGRAVGSASGNTGEEDNGVMNTDSGNSGIMARASHRHFLNLNINIPIQDGSVSGETAGVGNHYHQVSGSVSDVDQYPPYTSVVFCQKD